MSVSLWTEAIGQVMLVSFPLQFRHALLRTEVCGYFRKYRKKKERKLKKGRTKEKNEKNKRKNGTKKSDSYISL